MMQSPSDVMGAGVQELAKWANSPRGVTAVT